MAQDKATLPADPITTRGVRDLWGGDEISRQRVRDRMNTQAFRDACPEYRLDDGTRVWSKADVEAYTEEAKVGWTAGAE